MRNLGHITALPFLLGDQLSPYSQRAKGKLQALTLTAPTPSKRVQDSLSPVLFYCSGIYREDHINWNKLPDTTGYWTKFPYQKMSALIIKTT